MSNADANTASLPPSEDAAAVVMPGTLAHALRPQPDRQARIATTEPDPVSDDGEDDAPTVAAAEAPQRFAPVAVDQAAANGGQAHPPQRLSLSLGASNDLQSVSTREMAQAFTPVYHRRMVSSLGESRSSAAAGGGVNPFSRSFGSGVSVARATAQRRPSSPTRDELASAITPAYRTTPFGTSIRSLSPETQARVKEARRRARQLRTSLSRSSVGQQDSAAAM